MMNDEERGKLYEFCRAQLAVVAIAGHVDSMLAKALADALEEVAKAVDGKAKGWSDYKDSMPASATAEHTYAQGQINALTEASVEIRARKGA